MNPLISSFMRRLQTEFLKTRGYTKQRFTYSRQMDDYAERVRLRGSRWNGPERPWRFDIDFGVEFNSHSATVTSPDFPSTHSSTSLHNIVVGASADYSLRHNPSFDLGSKIMDRLDPSRQEVRVDDESELLLEIASNIEEASRIVRAARGEILRFCLSGDFSEQYFAITKGIEAWSSAKSGTEPSRLLLPRGADSA